MLKISNETKIGLLAVAAIALGIWGFKFLKGINILTASQTFYIRYADVEGLRPSSPVFISGHQVGMVKDIVIDPADDKTIVVVINIDRGIDVPKDATALIISASLMGGKAVSLEITNPCDGSDCAQSGDYLTGRTRSFLESMIGNPKELDAYTERLRIGLTALYDSIADPRHPQGLGHTLVALRESLENVARMTHKINRFLDASTGSLTATVNNAAEITRTLRDSNKNISATLDNMAAFSQQLRDAGMDQAGQKASVLMDSLTVSMSALRSTLVTAESALAKIDTLAAGLNNSEGSMGMLLHDPEFYDNMARTTRHLHLLLQDLRLNPKRYNTVKVKVFGKNKTGGYQSPLDDPAYDMLVDSLERDYSKRVKQ